MHVSKTPHCDADAWRYFGAHREGEAWCFRVLAPHADAVSVVGDFNDWDPAAHPMQRNREGVWEITVPGRLLAPGERYKLAITRGERRFLKRDPYARRSAASPDTASRLPDDTPYPWKDARWLSRREERFAHGKAERQPINVYELHTLTWMQSTSGEPLTYVELARELSTYVKQMGFTHVKLLPVFEHGNVASRGYHTDAFFAPSERQGSPRDFKAFVDGMHEAGIGVLLDWTPGVFSGSAEGLRAFDGEPLYEPSDPAVREGPGGETLCFDHARPEVEGFLLSVPDYWVEEYHIDGFYFDGVPEMLSVRIDRRADGGEERPSRNKAGEGFLIECNRSLAARHPGVMTLAAEEGLRRGVTRAGKDALGFHFRHSLGWAADTLAYATTDPQWRTDVHDKLTRSLEYAFSEHFLLPLSHREVAGGRRSLLDRMPGSYEEKFATVRLILTYLMTHPGKKSLFMGSEIGQFCEWGPERAVEWFLLDFPMHARLQLFTAKIHHLYLASPPLWEADGGFDGFRWIDAANRRASLLSYRRIDRGEREMILLFNFSTTPQENFLLAVPEAGQYRELLNTDDASFGGTGVTNPTPRLTEDCDLGGYRHGVRLNVAPLSAILLERE